MGTMTTTTPESRGRIAYTAYCKTTDFKAFNGTTLPMFDELGAPRQAAWIASAGVIWDLATTGRAVIRSSD